MAKQTCSKNKVIVDTNKDGDLAESDALTYLKTQGLCLIEKNFNCKLGEIDLVMQDDAHVVFVEVRLRRHPRFGSGLDSVTPHKQQKLRRTALFYLQQKKLFNKTLCRFDVVALDNEMNFNWIKDAF
jgi:putative endonuclease